MQTLKLSEGNTLIYIMILLSTVLLCYGMYILHCRISKLEAQQIVFEQYKCDMKSQLDAVQNDVKELPIVKEITEEEEITTKNS